MFTSGLDNPAFLTITSPQVFHYEEKAIFFDFEDNVSASLATYFFLPKKTAKPCGYYASIFFRWFQTLSVAETDQLRATSFVDRTIYRKSRKP